MEKRAVGSSRSFRNAPLHDAQHLQDVVAKEAVFNRQSLLPCRMQKMEDFGFSVI